MDAIDGTGRTPLPQMASAVVEAERLRRTNAQINITRVALSTALVITGDESLHKHFQYGADARLGRAGGVVMLKLTPNPEANRRPYQAKPGIYRWQVMRKLIPGAGALRFRATPPTLVETHPDGSVDITLPPTLGGVIKRSRPNKMIRPNHPRLNQISWEDVKAATMLINTFLEQTGDNTKVEVTGGGAKIRITRLDVAE